MANSVARAASAMAPPKDMSHHLSRTSQRRPNSSIKAMYKYFMIPNIGQIGGGLPNKSYFPYDKFEATVAVPDRFKPTPNRPVDPPTSSSSAESSSTAEAQLARQLKSTHLTVPQESGVEEMPRRIDLASALQYGTAQGYPPLYAWLREFTREHLYPNVPYAGGPEIVLTCGNTDGFGKALTSLNNEWLEERDPIAAKEGLLVEEYAYMNAVQTAAPRGMYIVPVVVDNQGMIAEGKGSLKEVLQNWDTRKGKRPHLLYTVTMGQNPTGGLLSVRRRKKIYKLCQEYDIIIIEDDPYWYLQYPSADAVNGLSKRREGVLNPGAAFKSSGFDFIDSLVPSFLAFDVDGRVIRLDSFSKTIAPGCRMGWMTAQPALIERMLRVTEVSTQQPSGFVQSMVAELLIGPQSKTDPGRGGLSNGKGWSFDGWVRWLEGLRGNYERRMNGMCNVLQQGRMQVASAPKGRNRAFEIDDEWVVVRKNKLYDFVRPMAGMFVWVEILFHKHPVYKKLPGPTLSTALWIYLTTEPFRVFVFPGVVFAPSQEIREEKAWKFFRLCFAACEEEEVEPLSQRFVDGVQKFWTLNADEIEKIIKDDEDEGQDISARQDLGQLGAWGGC